MFLLNSELDGKQPKIGKGLIAETKTINVLQNGNANLGISSQRVVYSVTCDSYKINDIFVAEGYWYISTELSSKSITVNVLYD